MQALTPDRIRHDFRKALREAPDEPTIEEYLGKLPWNATEAHKIPLFCGLLEDELRFRYEILQVVEPKHYERDSLKPYWELIAEVFVAAMSPPVPAAISNFEHLSLIGEGGMGRVYKASQKNPRRTVALKLMNPPNCERRERIKWIKRFIREGQKGVKFDFPGFATVYDIGIIEPGQVLPAGMNLAITERTYFFTMKFVDGPILTKAADLSLHALVDVLIHVAGTVEKINDGGVFHCDLKPANIVLDVKHAHYPYVVDLGLSRSDDAAATGNSIRGAATHPYMPPEALDSDFGPITRCTDVHGLGGILYTILTGRPPFSGLPAEMLDQTRKGPKPPSSLKENVDKELEAICMKAMKPRQKDRHASADEFAEALDDWKVNNPLESGDDLPPPQMQDATASSTIFGLDSFGKEAALALEEFIKQLEALKRGESTRPLLLDSNKFCDKAYRNGLNVVEERFWTLSSCDWGWFKELPATFADSLKMMDRLRQKKRKDNIRLLLFTRAKPEEEATHLLHLGREDAATLENLQFVHDKLTQLRGSGCEIRVCKLEKEIRYPGYRAAMESCHAPEGAGWTLFDDYRIDFFRISTDFGVFHDLLIVCKPMEQFTGLMTVMVPLFENLWNGAISWDHHWENLQNALTMLTPGAVR